jgi:hypothetical protein
MMYKVEIRYIGDEDHLTAQREEDKLWITVVQDNEALEIFIDSVHFPAIREAMTKVKPADLTGKRKSI